MQPSGADLAAASVPKMPLAPARFSTSTATPSDADSFCPTVRAARSAPAPGGKDTMILIGRLGHGASGWAAASSGADARASAAMTMTVTVTVTVTKGRARIGIRLLELRI